LPSKFYDLDLFKLIKTKSFDVVKAVVVRDKNSSKSLNYGYAQFKKQEDAVACQKALNNLEVEGKLTIWSLVVLD
jgi:RNA recognition motif-containing protein